MTRLISCLAASLVVAVVPATAAEDRRERVLNDRKEIEASGQWIYNDLPKGFAEAARTRKPMLVVFRCIP
jgi:serine protease Do